MESERFERYNITCGLASSERREALARLVSLPHVAATRACFGVTTCSNRVESLYWFLMEAARSRQSEEPLPAHSTEFSKAARVSRDGRPGDIRNGGGTKPVG
jgi:hypothetical protein